MTRRADVFVPLPVRVGVANAYRNAIFISVHYNSAPRLGSPRVRELLLPWRQLRIGHAPAPRPTRHAGHRRPGRAAAGVLRAAENRRFLRYCWRGGSSPIPGESRIVLSPSYRQRWAENVANAILAQSRQGDPVNLGIPAVDQLGAPDRPEAEAVGTGTPADVRAGVAPRGILARQFSWRLARPLPRQQPGTH